MNLNKYNKLFRFGVLFTAFFTTLVLIIFCPRLSATAYAESSTPETAATTYIVTYHANGGCWWSNWSRPTYSFATKKYEQEEGKTYQIIDSKPTYGANTFNGWNTESDGSGTWYSPHQEYVCTDNMDLYAQWRGPVPAPTTEPTATPEPTVEPTATPEPTVEPTVTPTQEPIETPQPSNVNKYIYKFDLNKWGKWLLWYRIYPTKFVNDFFFSQY